MLKQKLQYFGHLMWTADSLEKTWMLGKIEGKRIRGWQRLRWLDGIPDSMDMSLSKTQGDSETGKPGTLQPMALQRVGYDLVTEQPRTNTKHNLIRTRSEKAMAPHSSTLAWKIPWMEEPGRLQSMGSLRVGHDWVTSLSLFTFKHWRRQWQPTPMFLPGESQVLGSLVGCHLWGRTESNTTEAT